MHKLGMCTVFTSSAQMKKCVFDWIDSLWVPDHLRFEPVNHWAMFSNLRKSMLLLVHFSFEPVHHDEVSSHLPSNLFLGNQCSLSILLFAFVILIGGRQIWCKNGTQNSK